MGYDEKRLYESKEGTDCLSEDYIRLQHTWGGLGYYRKECIKKLTRTKYKVYDDEVLITPKEKVTSVRSYGDYQSVHEDFLAFLEAIGSDYKTDQIICDVCDKLEEGTRMTNYDVYESKEGIKLYVSRDTCYYAACVRLMTQKAIDIFSKIATPDKRIVWANVAEVDLSWDS